MEALMLMMIGIFHGETQPLLAIENLKKAEQIAKSSNIKMLETGLDFMIGGALMRHFTKMKKIKNI